RGRARTQRARGGRRDDRAAGRAVRAGGGRGVGARGGDALGPAGAGRAARLRGARGGRRGRRRRRARGRRRGPGAARWASAGGPGALGFALRTVRPGGAVVVLGLSGAEAIPVDVDSAVVRDVAIFGVLGSPHVWPDAIELVRSGTVDTAPLVSATYGLAQAR